MSSADFADAVAQLRAGASQAERALSSLVRLYLLLGGDGDSDAVTQAAALAAGAPAAVVAALRAHPHNMFVVTQAASVLHAVALRNLTGAEAVVVAGAVEPLRAALRTHVADSLPTTQVLNALMEVVLIPEGLTKAMTDGDGDGGGRHSLLLTICEAMQAHVASPQVARPGAGALANILLHMPRSAWCSSPAAAPVAAALLKALAAHPDIKVMAITALGCARNVLCGPPGSEMQGAFAAACVAHGAPRAVVAALYGSTMSDARTAVYACAVQMAMCPLESPPARKRRFASAVPPVVQLAVRWKFISEVAEPALETLACLTAGEPSNARAALAAGALRVALDIAAEHSGAAGAAMAKLALRLMHEFLSIPEGRDSQLAAPSVRACVAALRSGAVTEQALMALVDLTNGSVTNKLVAHAAGVLPHVVAALRTSDAAAVQIHALRLLNNMANGAPSVRPDMLASGALGAALDVLRTHGASGGDVLRASLAATTVRLACDGCAPNTHAALAAGAMALLTRCLRTHADVAIVARNTSGAMQLLLCQETERARTATRTCGAAAPLVDALERYADAREHAHCAINALDAVDGEARARLTHRLGVRERRVVCARHRCGFSGAPR